MFTAGPPFAQSFVDPNSFNVDVRTLQQKNKSDGVIKVRPIRKDENWVLAIDFNNLMVIFVFGHVGCF